MINEKSNIEVFLVKKIICSIISFMFVFMLSACNTTNETADTKTELDIAR